MLDASILQTIQAVIIYAIPIALAITLHEAAHGWTARQLGDRTAELAGRLSLNPLRHIDPIGTVVVPIALYLLGFLPFGWAKAVPVMPRNFRNPRRDMAIVAAAGPASNVVMALGWAFIAVLITRFQPGVAAYSSPLMDMAQVGLLINVVLAVINLLPLPPLDGGRVLSGVVPNNWALMLDRFEAYGLVIVMLLLATGIMAPVLRPAIDGLSTLVIAVARMPFA